MRLDHCTWREVDVHLAGNSGIILPAGSTEQHGPVGLIGTDSIVATGIAERAADICKALVAPTLTLAPAPFNTGFSGTISISSDLFRELAGQVIACLADQGFGHVYILNGHGANIEPLAKLSQSMPDVSIMVRNWWDFPPVNRLREQFYGDWEGMHATPSEIAITQVNCRRVPHTEESLQPPDRLDSDYISRHSGDRHGPPAEHRSRFPDGRVGSHSALARPEHGRELLEAAAGAVADEFVRFTGT